MQIRAIIHSGDLRMHEMQTCKRTTSKADTKRWWDQWWIRHLKTTSKMVTRRILVRIFWPLSWNQRGYRVNNKVSDSRRWKSTWNCSWRPSWILNLVKANMWTASCQTIRAWKQTCQPSERTSRLQLSTMSSCRMLRNSMTSSWQLTWRQYRNRLRRRSKCKFRRNKSRRLTPASPKNGRKLNNSSSCSRPKPLKTARLARRKLRPQPNRDRRRRLRARQRR